MTKYRTNLQIHEVAEMIGVSTKTIGRYVDRGWLAVAFWDAQGRRFREIEVLALKAMLSKATSKVNGLPAVEGDAVACQG